MLKMWKKEIRKILNTKTKIAISIIISLFLLFITSLAGYELTSITLSSFLNGDTRSLTLLTVSMFLNASIFTIVFFILFKTVASDYDRLSIQLSWLPVKSFEKNLGYFILFSSVIISLVFIIISLIILPAFLKSGVGIQFIFAFLLGLILQISFILFLTQGIYNLVNFIVKICKIPFTKLLTLFLLVFICLTYGLETIHIQKLLENYSEFDYNFMYLLTPIFLWIVQELTYMDVNIFLIFGVYVGVAIASYFSLFLMDTEKEKRSLKLLRFIPMPTSKLGALIVKEMKSQCRNEENLLNFILIVLLTILFSIKFSFDHQLVILFILSGTTGIIALNSFGNDLKMNSSYKLFGMTPWKVAFSKLVGLSILSFIQLIVYCLILMYVPETITVSLQIILISINSIALFYVAGMLIPLDKNNPYTGILAFSFLLCMLVPIFFIGNYVMGQVDGMLKYLIIIVFELLLGTILILINRWRFNYG